ncbi:MAG: leucine--tRNA ligase [Candidatus Nealsonbacteria bacterium]
MSYKHQEIEPKWQKYWEEKGFYKAEDFSKKPKKYILIEFPYPSGEGLHMGHVRPYAALDALSRKKRMEGYNVLFPMGWDAFGLPTENYAIRTGIHPKEATKKNVSVFKRQLKSLGLSFDWSREVNTTDPEYYKWTQWIFLKLFEKGLAYQAEIPVNWCPSCKIGLANEEVIDGKCERCGALAEKRTLKQWMIKITVYADRLIEDLKKVDFPDKVKSQQINWIGRSYGVNFKNKVKGMDIEFEVYDSIPQTHMAQTFIVVAPEHPLVEKLVKDTEYEKPVMSWVEKIIKKKAENKFDIEKDKDGIFTGRYVENWMDTGRDLPIWVASFAVVDYGTGIVNCSVHDKRDFEFAKEHNIPLHPVLFPKDKELAEKIEKTEVFYREPDGILKEPKEFAGRRWDEVREPMIDWLVKRGKATRTVNYHLRDWVFSRQHYWGEPIPIIHCERCGQVPVPEKDLPVELPYVEKYQPTGTGESPLASISDWVNIKCPKCRGEAKRETDTMPNWAGSNWYYMRYCDPKNKNELADKKKLEYWLPVDWYNGGMEHTTLHLLYSRFIYKFLFDIKSAPTPEPYQKRTSHGIILAEDNRKMSKSFGNVVNPDEIISKFGADSLRMYEMFMGPFDQAISWNSQGVKGVYRFLEKIWKLVPEDPKTKKSSSKIESALHRLNKKIDEDIESTKFNTIVSAFMEFVNLIREEQMGKEDLKRLIILLSPFAPHIAEELWQKMGNKESVFLEKWPDYNKKLIKEEKINLIIQVNGKVRGKIEALADISEEEANALAISDEKVKNWILGKDIKKVVFVPGKLINIVI